MAGSCIIRLGAVHQPKQLFTLRPKGKALRIDELDRQIIALLVANGRASYAEIGAAVSLSAPAVKRRVDRLRATGVIRGFTTVLDPAAVGWTTEAFVELFCVGRTTPGRIAEAARRHPEVVAAYTVSGEADALVHLRAADIAHLEQALERLRAEPFVTSTRSTIVLSSLVTDASAAVTGSGSPTREPPPPGTASKLA